MTKKRIQLSFIVLISLLINSLIFSNTALGKNISADTIKLRPSFLYDSHTLKDQYLYRKTQREFQWGKIKYYLALLEEEEQLPAIAWGSIQNYKNSNGRAPLVKESKKDPYRKNTDSYYVQQDQGIPLYQENDMSIPIRYGQDGSLVRIIKFEEAYTLVEVIDYKQQWMVPNQYLRTIDNIDFFNKVIFIDRTNQNIATIEKVNDEWLIRSMNPATTGLHNPPYMQETPTGIFIIQSKKRRMDFYRDGTTVIGGFAPYASRFTTGAYIHGVPINLPKKNEVEWSASLGTTPRSHKCVRNPTSHAKYVYTWAPIDGALVIVID